MAKQNIPLKIKCLMDVKVLLKIECLVDVKVLFKIECLVDVKVLLKIECLVDVKVPFKTAETKETLQKKNNLPFKVVETQMKIQLKNNRAKSFRRTDLRTVESSLIRVNAKTFESFVFIETFYKDVPYLSLFHRLPFNISMPKYLKVLILKEHFTKISFKFDFFEHLKKKFKACFIVTA